MGGKPATELPNLEELFVGLVSYRSVGIAVSGGPDSMALMVLLARWAQDLGSAAPNLMVYTVNHGLRAAAVAETELVCREAKKLGLQCRVLEWQGDKPSTGLQAAARMARYGLIGQAMASDSVDILVTAHHSDDQAETVLMRLAHGSGLGGLAGMAAFSHVENVHIHRPLLAVTRASLASVLTTTDITPVNDPSNEDTSYERVRWRQALPMLAELGLDSNRLGQLAKRAARADQTLRATSEAAFSQIVARNPFGTISIDAVAFDECDLETRIRVLQMALAQVGGRQRRFALGQVEGLADQLATTQNLPKQTLLGCVVARNDSGLTIRREQARISQNRVELPAGARFLWDDRFLIENLSQTDDMIVAHSHELTRGLVEPLLGENASFTMDDVRTAPTVYDGHKTILAIGARVLRPQVSVALTH